MFDLLTSIETQNMTQVLVVVFSYLVLGLTGFGSALVAVPLLLVSMPLVEAVPLVLYLDVVAFTVFGALNLTHIDWPMWRRTLPSMVVGVVCAGASLHFGLLPGAWLLLCLGLYILGFGLLQLRLTFRTAAHEAIDQNTPKTTHRSYGSVMAFAFGWAAGVVETWFGTCGPIVVASVLKQTTDMARFKATVAILILSASLMALITYALAHVASPAQTQHELLRAAGLTPVAVIAVWLGHRFGPVIPQHIMRRAVYLLLCISGLALIVKAVQG